MFLFGRVHGLDALRRRNDRGSDEGDGVGRLASFKSPTVSNHVRGLLFHSLRGGGRKALSPQSHADKGTRASFQDKFAENLFPAADDDAGFQGIRINSRSELVSLFVVLKHAALHD